uniref:Tyrosine--tRNA ligase n=1 Tax=candidate division CPR3 bacterium TaxID=2268181 RepID=A0A7C4M2A6_UNCC3
MKKSDEEKIQYLLKRGVANIYPTPKFLENQLKSGKKLTIYMGIDPTGEIHLGHAVSLFKMKQFQDLGHKIIILMGDFTAQIGDPTDKSAARVRLTHEKVLENAKNYKKLISKIINFNGDNAAEFKYNSKWLGKMSFEDVVELASHFTVQRMMERDMFEKRLKEQKPIYLHEFLYPLMQGYDSVAMDVDGEVGGNDQTFNMLTGRDLLKSLKNKEKFVLTMKLLEDPSTGKKMSKTEGNAIELKNSPEEMFGKVMSWPDEMILIGFELLTSITDDGIKMFAEALKKGENPRNIKFKLAEEVVSRFFDYRVAEKSGEKFNLQFKEGRKPQYIPEIKVSKKMISIVDLVFELKMSSSKGEARRLIEQGGVKIDDAKITDREAIIGVYDGMIVQVGKLKYAKLKI